MRYQILYIERWKKMPIGKRVEVKNIVKEF